MSPMSEFVDPRARELFAQALGRVASEREQFLAMACGDDRGLRKIVAELLAAHDDANGRLVESGDQLGERPGDRVGRFKLRQKIGEGGFGTVWMAEQEAPVRRKVALKVLKAGMDTAQVVGRFEAERQALAMMDHPHIAKVFDGGATPQGRPYFIMELVKGVPITQYCDEAGLDMRERLELFVPVCQAVQHAHQKGVIHRDLKPSNVLVTLHDGKPVPKVIDFGIAKATQGHLTDRSVFTEFRQMLGTPVYMAPEQAELSGLDVDTRADIYSLGVLLYELLTGTRPFELETLLQAGYAEMVRTIREVDPPKPSTRVSTLGEQLLAVAKHRHVHPRALGVLMRGDLDWIVMKALEKERSRRYETATALADDVLRHLQHEPVLAGPPSRLYRWRKYARRNRVGLAASAAIVASLVVGIVVALFGYRQARDQTVVAQAAERRAEAALLGERTQREAAETARAEAVREAKKAKTSFDLLASMLSSSDPDENKGRDYPVRLLLSDFEQAIVGDPDLDPDVEAQLRTVAGRSYLGLGMPQAAEPHFARALVLLRGLPEAAPGSEAALLTDLAHVRHDQGRYDEQLVLLEQAESMLLVGEETEDVGKVHGSILVWRAAGLKELGRMAEAEAAARAALAVVREHFDDESLEVADKLRILADILADRGRLAEAEEASRQDLALRRKLLGPEHVRVASSLNSLACVLSESGKDVEAEGLLQETADMQRKLLGLGHPSLATTLHNLAGVLGGRGELTDAEQWQREAVRIGLEALGPEHPDVASFRAGLADILARLGQRAEAEVMMREALAAMERQLGSDNLRVGTWQNNLGVLLQRLGNHEEAEDLLCKALASARSSLGETHPSVGTCLANIARVQEAREHFAEAEESARSALEACRLRFDRDHPEAARRQFLLARIQRQTRHLAAAEDNARQALAMIGRLFGDESLQVANGLNELGLVLRDRRKLADAKDVLQQALDLNLKLRRADNEDTAAITLNLATVLLDQGRAVGPEAEELCRKALKLRRQILGADHPRVAFTMHVLARVLVIRWKRPEAERVFRSALEKLRAAHGEESAEVANCMQDLAGLLSDLERLAEAQELFGAVLAMRQKLLGAEHELVAVTMTSQAVVLRRRNDLAPAEALARQALAIERRLLAAGDVQIAATLQELGWIQLERGDPVAAESSFREAADIQTRRVGERHILVANLAALRGIALADAGRFGEGEAELLQALAARAEYWGEGHMQVAMTASSLGDLYSKRSDLAKAEHWYQQALAMERKILEEDDERQAPVLQGLARCRLASGRLVEAETAAREALALRVAKREGSWQHRAAMALLGRVLLAQGRQAEAEPLLAEACAKMQPPPRHLGDLRLALTELIGLYERSGRDDDVVALRERLAQLPPARFSPDVEGR